MTCNKRIYVSLYSIYVCTRIHTYSNDCMSTCLRDHVTGKAYYGNIGKHAFMILHFCNQVAGDTNSNTTLVDNELMIVVQTNTRRNQKEEVSACINRDMVNHCVGSFSTV